IEITNLVNSTPLINTSQNLDLLTMASPHNPRFSHLRSSPTLDDTSDVISFASQNVRSISNRSKFESILGDFFQENISVIGLQETRITERTATSLFKDYIASFSSEYVYKAYWSYDTSDRAGGVGLIFASFISKYVQKIHRHKSRFISVDLYLPSRKLRIINLYCPQKNDYASKGASFYKFVINHIKDAMNNNFYLIIMGDFNV